MYDTRWGFWKTSLKGWWIVVSAVLWLWGAFGNYRSDFISEADQAKLKLPVLFPHIEWRWLFITFLVITLVALLEGAFRAHRSMANQFRQEFGALQARLDQALTQPCFKGAIDAAYVHVFNKPRVFDPSSGGCEFAIVVHFANTASVVTSLVTLELEVKIRETIHLVPSEGSPGLASRAQVMFRDLYGTPKLVERLSDTASQGHLFQGYLRFTLPEVIIYESDVLRVERLIITDAHGNKQPILPSGNAVVELREAPGSWVWPAKHAGLTLVHLCPPLMMGSTEPAIGLREQIRVLSERVLARSGKTDQVQSPVDSSL